MTEQEKQQIAEEERKAEEASVLLEYALDIITKAQPEAEKLKESEAKNGSY